ncbi:GM24929 [Drosophila sechellia]|uniref:GM24929 n=1 Tax=Drosophila sechellia TaxID=7238 RepID=B4HJZ1_DROSE|nr:GM24929 [Drosophila sechellia]
MWERPKSGQSAPPTGGRDDDDDSTTEEHPLGGNNKMCERIEMSSGWPSRS